MNEVFKMFDVIIVDFGKDTVGSEQDGIRPAIIIQNDTGNYHSPTLIVAPITTQLKKLHQPTHALIKQGRGTGLKQDSMVMVEAMKQVDKRRVKYRIGSVKGDYEREAIRKAYYASFGD